MFSERFSSVPALLPWHARRSLRILFTKPHRSVHIGRLVPIVSQFLQKVAYLTGED